MALLLQFFVISFAILAELLFGCSPVQAAETFCDDNCPQGSHGKFFCVSSDPAKYTRCVYGRRVIRLCAGGLVWDSAIGNCNWNWAVTAPCTCGSGTTTTETATAETASSPSESGGYCDNNCPRGSHGQYFCVESDASKYTLCSGGQRTELSCGEPLVWDSSINGCNWRESSAKCTCGGLSAGTTPTTASTATPTTTTTTPPMTTPTTTSTTSPTTTSTTTASNNNNDAHSSMHKICYFTNWAQYRTGVGQFKPDNIDASLCSHIVYAFYNFDTTHIYNREWNEDALLAQVMSLKEQNPALQVLLSIGGWNAGIQTFQQIIATQSSRSRFNQAAISFLRQKKFDGIDIDMEYPGRADRGGLPSDKPRFAAWMEEMAAAFNAEAATTGKARLLLTAAIGAGPEVIDNGYDVPRISAALDFIHVMTYDFHGSWDGITGFNAPLYKLRSWTGNLAKLTTSYSINYLLSKGAPAGKLVVGIPLYGRTYTLRNAENTGIGAPTSGPGQAGQYTKEAGFLSYYETCSLKNSYTYRFNSRAKVPFMYSGSNWISTEDQRSVTAKAQFVVKKNLGGVMYWALDLDDFSNVCGAGRYPLMKAVSRVLDA